MTNPLCPPFQRGKPTDQPYYKIDEETWMPWNAPHHRGDSPLPSTVRLITWNIDANAEGAAIRMESALSYLGGLVSRTDLPVVIFLQEMVRSDLEQIQAAEWVKKRFYLTDMTNKHWECIWYGTTTLVDNRLDIERVFRVHMETRMGRDGLFVDVAVRPSEGGEKITLRLCNAHLESLIADPPLRPGQLALAAQYMHAPEAHASVLAGDCNSIQPFDRTLHSENGLKDVYLELGGKEDSENGYTWGQMAHESERERFGCSRMDKIMYCGWVRVEGLEVIGKDIRAEEKYWKMMESWGAMNFVTDHYGLMADLTVVGKGGGREGL